jgi:hypothetical protein
VAHSTDTLDLFHSFEPTALIVPLPAAEDSASATRAAADPDERRRSVRLSLSLCMCVLQ